MIPVLVEAIQSSVYVTLLNFFYLHVGQFQWRLSSENFHHYFQLAFFFIYFFYDAVKSVKRTINYFNRLSKFKWNSDIFCLY